MRTLLFLLIPLLAMACALERSPALARGSGALRPLYLVGDESYAPYSYRDAGEARGIDVEVVGEMARRLGLELRLELVSRARLRELLASGECDGAFALRPTRENLALAQLLRSAPLHAGSYSAFIKTSERFSIAGLEDLRGKDVGVLEAQDLGREFAALAREGAFRVLEFADESRAVGALLRGQVEVFLGQTQAVQLLLAKGGMSGTIQAEGPPLVRAGGEYLGLSLNSDYPEKEALARLMELALRDMLADGTYRRIVHRYIL
jgi:polar amino acid transport system substrate-binding protein